jgi:PHD/YefM family antitoxin component YafN of YafNO toxin-antitoxin module
VPKQRKVEIVLRDGKPSAVILDIAEYERLLERAEDLYDLKMLAEMRKSALRFRTLEDFLQEHESGVSSSA